MNQTKTKDKTRGIDETRDIDTNKTGQGKARQGKVREPSLHDCMCERLLNSFCGGEAALPRT